MTGVQKCALRSQGQGIAIDANGNAYVTGLTDGSTFPVTPGAFQTTGSFDAFVTKFNPQGSALVYSTYLGGSAGSDRGWAIAVDDAGSAYITGDTTSTNFPVASSVQPAYGGGLSDAFVTKLNAGGSALVYSTFLGGSLYDEGRGIDLDGSGNVFAIGSTSSDNFPTANPMQGSNGGGLNNHDDAFVVKLGAAGSTTTLSSLTLNPTSVTGGASLQGTVTLSSAAPSGGAVVMLASSNGTVASVPPSVTVAAGATNASFTVTTTPVSVSTTVNISATYAGLTKTATLTVRSPATADTVAITLAQYRLSTKKLSIQATSTNATATLKVYITATGQLIGTLTNNGGNYSGQFKWPTNPQNITVRSSLGGSSSAIVTVR